MPDDATKRCRECGEVKSLDEYPKRADAPDGHRSKCKSCTSDAGRQRYQANRDAVLESKQRYYRANREAARERGRRWREVNREHVREQARLYYEANREKIVTRARDWYEANRESVLDRMAEYGDDLHAIVFGHYGTACACCGVPGNLSIDHINGDGREHRAELFGGRDGGLGIYLWLIRNDFPAGFQTLCMRCNSSKKRGERCLLDHTKDIT